VQYPVVRSRKKGSGSSVSFYLLIFPQEMDRIYINIIVNCIVRKQGIFCTVLRPFSIPDGHPSLFSRLFLTNTPHRSSNFRAGEIVLVSSFIPRHVCNAPGWLRDRFGQDSSSSLFSCLFPLHRRPRRPVDVDSGDIRFSSDKRWVFPPSGICVARSGCVEEAHWQERKLLQAGCMGPCN